MLVGKWLVHVSRFLLRNATVVNVAITNVALPRAFEDAIQNTEIARQAKEAAVFEKETKEINAQTLLETAKVEIVRLKHQALRTAEMKMMERVSKAIQVRSGRGVN